MPEIVEHIGPDGEVSRLPAGERVLWQGAPDQRAIARWFLRERWVLGFVALSAGLGVAAALRHVEGLGPRLIGVGTLSVILAIVAIVAIRVFAWQIAKSSSYVITDRRVYFNIGMVLRADANVPYSSVDRIDLLRRSDGSADLMVTLAGDTEIPWLLLFPHMSWRGATRGRPTFRGLRAPEPAADAISNALREYVMPADGEASAVSASSVPSAPRASIAGATPSPA